MKVIIDTNCLLLSIPPKNPEFWLYEAFVSERFEWIISNEILSEYVEQLEMFYSYNTAVLVSNILISSPNVTFKEPFYKWNLIEKDPDDDKFADLAISANVNYLVTEDRHFNILKTLPFPTVEVVNLKQFKRILDF
jgi:uncharacterized protein